MTKFSAPQQNQLAQIGAFLRENREKQAKSLEDIAIRTYIRPQLLNGIETGNPDTLPEPIFVQGFIRRYAETLGLNGVDLSQQFTVTSIPSTPRPARSAPPEDSPTTRLTRPSSASMPSSANMDDQSIPMFSAGGASFTETQMGQEDDLLTLGKETSEPLFKTNSDFDRVDNRDLERDIPTSSAFDRAINDVAADHIGSDRTSADISETPPIGDISSEAQPEQQLEATHSSTTESVDDDFASEIAAFDQVNLGEPSLEPSSFGPTELSNPPLEQPPLEPPALGRSDLDQTVDPPAIEPAALNEQSVLGSTANVAFDDDLPAAYTTEAEPLASQASHEPMPVGVEYGDQPNLKPFIIGGVLAAIAVLALLLASVLGGGNRQPQVADTVESAEPLEATTELPKLPEEAVSTTPPASTAPVYVEATATAEAWVSVIADDNTLFEGTLQPGDTQVWEAQENLNIYTGDAGALELAANGEDAEVMGERGQPEEKVFTQ